MATIPTVTPLTLPVANRTMAQATFSQAIARAFSDMAVSFPQLNTFAAAVNAAALEFDAELAAAVTAKNAAQAARSEAVSLVNTPVWNAGTNYGANSMVKSPTDLELYVRKVPGGTDSQDPAFDTAESKWSRAPLFNTVARPAYITGPKTFSLADANVTQIHPSTDISTRTVTIPSNDSVPFGISTVIPIINRFGAGTISINIMTDTLRLAGSGATGTRTLAVGGMCSLVKSDTNEWMISGVGLS